MPMLINRILARGRDATHSTHSTVSEGGYQRDEFTEQGTVRVRIRPREAGPFKVMAVGEVDPETRWAYARHDAGLDEDDRLVTGQQEWRVADLQPDPDRNMVRVRLLPDDR